MKSPEVTEEYIQYKANEVFSAMEKRSTLEEMQLMHEAFRYAREAHREQKRKTGEPYIIHPIAVARIVAEELQLGCPCVCAAFLHDVVEDTPTTIEKIQELFGKDVAFLVYVVTKQKKASYSMSKQLDNFKQMLDSMHYDVRAILIKLADRLHNMRTLESMRPDKQMKIAGETDYFYAPLANRLGLYTIKIELENLSFKYRCPQWYFKILDLIEKDKQLDKTRMKTFNDTVDSILRANGIQYRREVAYKQPYNIWRKMKTQGEDYEHLECRHFTRIVFPNDMYMSDKNMVLKIYSLLTDKFKERPGAIINYIDLPKQNGYQAFHTQLLSDYGVWEEIHIQSERMSKKTRLGYLFDSGQREIDITKWLNDFRNVLKDVADNAVMNGEGDFFIQSVRASFYNDDIQVYTPNGKAVLLPKGSSAIDFAFNIHTDIGMHAKYAKINGHLASVRTRLKRGDCVEIGTSPDVWPNEGWLKPARSYKALRNIHMYLDSQPKPEYHRCPVCHPIPGEEVIGFRQSDGKVMVHRRDCQDAISQASQQGDSIVAVDYKEDPHRLYPATITAKAVDRQHLLSDIIDSISNKLQLSIDMLHTVTEDDIVTCQVKFFVHSNDELNTIISSILDIPDVDEVNCQTE
ncbi:MAG: bifunctional (p)ppGpp synthetase/guanosine-3',5'-bis(diphosphate) 3'-pyrophosphohydrolase [Prevotella sp.]|nr:bifunctional (p)ppGpp synthetase/guanosine-3',5'-bis(diphosphate) 3'-pyrophosphohydrolase [Prevotella sp.]MBQ9560764.1 bifunctional (p)ppGpp synthetase/guanosine-3',5'-bis(diphosphate) 3'-pyrophosphohydrolase [Prevotella sp.]MBR1839229.1 bifunctional (p)ppGpp synthetase/guanosine-3',5'-bis(diphosphate) 3'-pyrophosphohydrolase [Prevotella sp.]